VVETGGLENRCTRKGIGGSNPSPSATHLLDRTAEASLGEKYSDITQCFLPSLPHTSCEKRAHLFPASH
jgi:hypothetical protein